jgi:hypothetical protein
MSSFFDVNNDKMSLRALSRIYRLPAGSFFLFGLRGVGKSTWIREQLPDAHRFDPTACGLELAGCYISVTS